ncbi:MAG: transposase [Candidatus Hydrogenedentes bacterium]|nr:transposase [Candidatus Hydrogenedentota bacterium]
MNDENVENTNINHNPPTAKPGKTFYRRNLPHMQKLRRPIFITFRTRPGLILPESTRTQVLNHCLHDHGHKLHMHCAVVMPDHVHLLLTLLEDSDGMPYSLEEIMSGIKGASSHTVNACLKRKGKLWQDESFDHVLRSDQSTHAKAQYICDNPIRKGLVSDLDDYPWLWREWVEGEGEAKA